MTEQMEGQMVFEVALRDGQYTLPQRLQYWAQKQGDLLALREKIDGQWAEFSWQDYYNEMAYCAAGLEYLGFHKGDVISILGNNTRQWLFTDLGSHCLGGLSVGVYPTNPWKEVHYIVNHSRSKFVLCGDKVQFDKIIEAQQHDGGFPFLKQIIVTNPAGIPSEQAHLYVTYDDLRAKGKAFVDSKSDAWIAEKIAQISPQNVATIVYTSGTTGLPKGAQLTHEGLIYGAVRVAERYGLNRDNWQTLCYLPLCHVAERLASTMLQLMTGSVVSFNEGMDKLVANLIEIKPSGFLGVPRVWEKMQQAILLKMNEGDEQTIVFNKECLQKGKELTLRRLQNGGHFVNAQDQAEHERLREVCFKKALANIGFDNIEHGMCGGAPISAEVLTFFWSMGVQVWQIYGMSEMSGVTHGQTYGHTIPGSSGIPLPDFEQKQLDDGELLIQSKAAFVGYLYNEDATREAIGDGWYRTGDIVRFDDQHNIFIEDRKKHIIITSGGKNITPALIEGALKDSYYISEAILLGDGRHYLSALIQIDPDTVGKWAKDKGISYAAFDELATHKDVFELIDAEVARVNEQFSRVENVRKFALLKKPLTHDDGEMTATMKVRRKIIEQKFAEEINLIYGDD